MATVIQVYFKGSLIKNHLFFLIPSCLNQECLLKLTDIRNNLTAPEESLRDQRGLPNMISSKCNEINPRRNLASCGPNISQGHQVEECRMTGRLACLHSEVGDQVLSLPQMLEKL